MRILVADDDSMSLRMMQRTLEKSGYEVITARNGREAAAALARPDGPRLALIDWMMPELDGPGVCRAVRSLTKGFYVYILLLTAKQSSEDVVMGLKAGADDYLKKPIHPAELEARLHTGMRILELEDRLVQAREEMRFKATHDALTAIWDRGGILSMLRKELSRAEREKTPLSLLLSDIDHFKSVNDRYGHQVGDEVLQHVAARFQSIVRPTDGVGRYGGEEFLMVLGGCGAEALRRRAEQLRVGICGTPFVTQIGPVSISTSIGAVTIERWESSMSIDPFLKEADVALYQAKAAGRNRVVVAEALLPSAC
jgi:diguanylate cyclase (GGDEF)-like protein